MARDGDIATTRDGDIALRERVGRHGPGRGEAAMLLAVRHDLRCLWLHVPRSR